MCAYIIWQCKFQLVVLGAEWGKGICVLDEGTHQMSCYASMRLTIHKSLPLLNETLPWDWTQKDWSIYSLFPPIVRVNKWNPFFFLLLPLSHMQEYIMSAVSSKHTHSNAHMTLASAPNTSPPSPEPASDLWPPPLWPLTPSVIPLVFLQTKAT